jgi:hypothetical protein
MPSPSPIPFPLSSFPGANPQEGAGRLINCYAEPLGEPAKPSAPAPQVWRGSAGLSQHAITAQTGYRGGLTVNNLAYEIFLNNASTVTAAGASNSLGAFPGTKQVSIARDQASNPDVVAVDVDNGAYILNTTNVANASATVTIAGTKFVPGDTIALFLANTAVSGFPVNIIYTLGSSESASSIAAGLKALINANATLVAANVSATNLAGVLTILQAGFVGNATNIQATVTNVGTATTLTGTVTGTGNETVTVVPGTGTATATIAGSVFTAGDTVTLTFANSSLPNFPVALTHTLGAGENATIIATALTTLINANATLAAASITAVSALGVITITEVIGNETATLNPLSGTLGGGAGTPGIVFVGIPLAYNALGILPQPNSVCNQDGYFFYTIGDGRVFASALNSLAVNALTYITCQAKADVTLLRGVPFNGVLLLFTTGACEVWQDVANPAPNFPYGRLMVLEFGLIQSGAIAGNETGFSELLWVAQDFGVYWLTAGSLAPVKVSPSDLDRLIEAQVKAGNLLNAGCYSVGGKKFWHISSPAWTWEFNLSTKKWNERSSLNGGVYGRWRASGGHPAFSKWLVGDQQSGNILFLDDANFSENGAFQLFRIESGPVRDFPQSLRIARADFDFVMGTATPVGNFQMVVLGAASGSGGVVRLTVNGTSQAKSGDEAQVVNVGGTVEANGTFPMVVVDATHIELAGTKFVDAYTSGGTVTDITAPVGAVNPQCAISCSKNGGQSFDTPSIRPLAPQGKVKRSRASVKNRGQSGAAGVRWRIDITDPVYRGLMGATMSSDPREVAP